MKRTFRKTTAFVLAMATMFSTVAGISPVEVSASSKKHVSVLADNVYEDGVRLGDGYLLLENGKLKQITNATKYIYIDKDGKQKEIKNNVGFDKIYYSTTGATYVRGERYSVFNENGLLLVGKDNKVGVMDHNSVMFGGTENFYESVLCAGPQMFFTTNATINKSNKTDTNQWTLRKKDGTVIKEFSDLEISFYPPIYANSLQYVSYRENGKGTFSMIDNSGRILSTISGFDSYPSIQIKEGSDYVVVTSGNKTCVLKNSGQLVFELEGYYSFDDIDNLSTVGYAAARTYTSDGSLYKLMSQSGEVVFSSNKKIISYDDKNLIYGTKHGDETVYNYEQKKDILNAQEEYKNNYPDYQITTQSLYLVDHDIVFSVIDEKELYNDTYNTAKIHFYNTDGTKSSKEILDGQYQSQSKAAMAITTGFEKYKLITFDRKIQYQTEYSDYITPEMGNYPNSSIAAVEYSKEKGYRFLTKGGTVTDWYSSYDDYDNGNKRVETTEGKYGIVDTEGCVAAEPIYDSIKMLRENDYSIAQKNDRKIIINDKGQEVESDDYEILGNYDSEFSEFPSKWNDYTYDNSIGSNLMALTVKVDQSGDQKVGLISLLDGITVTEEPKPQEPKPEESTPEESKPDNSTPQVPESNPTEQKPSNDTQVTPPVQNPVVSQPVKAPGKVAGLKVSKVKSDRFTVSWTKQTGAAGYTVYYYNTKTKKDVVVSNVSSKTTKLTISKLSGKKLESGKKYTVKVAAYKKDNSKKVYGSKASISATTKVNTPSSFTVKASGKNKAKLTWKKVSGASGYQIYQANSKQGKYKLIKSINKGSQVSFTTKKLTKKNTYFKVRAYKTVSGKKVYSSDTSIKNLKLK